MFAAVSVAAGWLASSTRYTCAPVGAAAPPFASARYMRVLPSFTTGENVKRPLAVRLKIVSKAASFVERTIPTEPIAANSTFGLPGSKRTS